jgi:large subunit ribosomal protein L20
MARVKGGKTALKRRKNILKQTKGFRFGRSTKKRQAREAIFKAGTYAFRDRREKKNVFRQLWIVRMNAALREHGLSYSKFIGMLKKKNIILDRKTLADLAANKPETFARLVAQVQS